nr:YopX family protein [Lacticaseibacillus rhamnosus]
MPSRYQFTQNILHSQDNYELMQYTGLKDKNGREIYEGDIIVTHPKSKYEAPESGVVQYGGSRPMFGYKTEDGEEYDIWSSNAYRTYEVIGNIFENPEMLEADENDD